MVWPSVGGCGRAINQPFCQWLDLRVDLAYVMRMSNALRRPTNVSLPTSVVDEARELGINISQACEKGVVAEIAARRRERWLEENLPAIEAHNEWVERNGLPLAEYRQF